MCLELLRGGHVVDDERLDIRLIKDWIDLKRAQYIKNMLAQNPNNRISLNLYQNFNITLDEVAVTTAGDYPYINNTTQSYKIMESNETLPSILEGKNGPMVLSLESEDLMKLPFSFIDYDYLRFAGNGKFNSGLIFGSLRDNKIYFKHNAFFDTYTNVVLRSIFENPRDVSTEASPYSDETTEYPADYPLIEYIKNGIIKEDLKFFINAPTDEINDSSGEIKS